MDTAKAIQLLHRLSDEQFDGEYGDERREALEMAVRALEGDGDTISRQAAITTAVRAAIDWHRLANPQYSIAYCIGEAMRQLPSAQPEYEPVTAEDFAKTMSENALYGYMAWHGEAITLMNEMGFVICKKTM